MSRICPLFSGSTGNSTYISTKNGGILVDAGASFKGICEEVEKAGGAIEEILAVAVTHEHIDHIKGLKTLLNKTNATLIASEKTLQILENLEKIPAKTKVMPIGENSIDLNGILINRFATSHDCEGSSGYTFILPEDKKISVATDLGIVTNEVRDALSGSEVLLFESNHDIEMLKKGPYPPNLKVRILSDNGHISNNACAVELPFFLKKGTKKFILGHLSQQNNTPLLAKSCATAALIDVGAIEGKDYILNVAKPNNNGVIIV